jgi:type IV pilus assembly protein PilA
MKRLQRGFTLIELMIVVAIIGILAAVAIPAYQDYIARAQVSEAISLLSSGKAAMAEHFTDHGYWPPDTATVMGSTGGKYTASVTITGAPTTLGTLTLTATMQSSGINTAITSGTVSLWTSDGGKVWTCTQGLSGTALATKYLPSACR